MNTGVAYDASGNLLNDGSLAYTWDAESRLKTAGTTTYTYNGDGKRVEKSTGKLYWYGTGSDPLVETNSAGGSAVEYVFFDGKRIARRDASGNVDYYVADHLSSSRVVTNSAGSILDDLDFYPFGGARAVVGPSSGNNYKFTGKERDTESGNDNFGARYYESNLGRFMTADPENAGADASDPQTWNAYGYVRNSPTTLTDPTGEMYQVCQSDANGNQTNCGRISDEQFAQFEQENHNLFTFTGGNTGNILYEGNEVGTFHQTSVDLSPFASGVIAGVNANHPGDFIAGVAGASVVAGSGVGLGLYATSAGAGLTSIGLQAAPAIAPLLPAVPSAIDKLQKLAGDLAPTGSRDHHQPNCTEVHR